MKQVFISYRRTDSIAESRLLATAIDETFGHGTSFLDLSIPAGMAWRAHVYDAVRSATVVLAVIGPRWLTAADAAGRRRLDQADDVVRAEIEAGLSNGDRLIPVLLSSATMPEAGDLPPSIAELPERNAFALRLEHFDYDRTRLDAAIAERGVKRLQAPVGPCLTNKRTETPLAASEIMSELCKRREWSHVCRASPAAPGGIAEEIHTQYKFRRFEDAMAFMAAAAPYMSELKHHADWSNCWDTVAVWLTTWGAGHRVSRRDFELAKRLDDLYSSAPGASSQR